MYKLSILTAGGAVQAGDGVYIRRKADGELLQLCRAGTYAYVLSARQVGKTSLVMEAAKTLREEGVSCFWIELTQIGSPDAEVTYRGLVSNIVRKLMPEFDLSQWWDSPGSLRGVARLTAFFREGLTELDAPDYVSPCVVQRPSGVMPTCLWFAICNRVKGSKGQRVKGSKKVKRDHRGRSIIIRS